MRMYVRVCASVSGMSVWIRLWNIYFISKVLFTQTHTHLQHSANYFITFFLFSLSLPYISQVLENRGSIDLDSHRMHFVSLSRKMQKDEIWYRTTVSHYHLSDSLHLSSPPPSSSSYHSMVPSLATSQLFKVSRHLASRYLSVSFVENEKERARISQEEEMQVLMLSVVRKHQQSWQQLFFKKAVNSQWVVLLKLNLC